MDKLICPVCSNTEFRLKYNLQDYWHDPEGPEFTYRECSHCKLLIQYPALSAEELIKHYQISDRYDKPDNVGILKFFQRVGLWKRTRMLSDLPVGKLLDVGFGHGEFIAYMHSIGWIVTGTEINKTMSNKVIPAEATVFYGSLEELQLPEASYDLVTMWDVLEHTQDLNKSIISAKRLLRSRAFLLIRVPNSKSLDAKLFGRYWAGNDAPRHLYVFNEDNLRILLRQHQLKVVKIDRKIGSFLNFMKSVEFWLNACRNRSVFLKTLLRLLKTPFLRVILYPLFLIKDGLFEGTSLTVLAQIKD